METILIIEDEKYVRENIAELLSNEGYKTICKSNGKEALELLTHTVPDLILSDIMMPELNGIELLKKLNEQKLGYRIPFIFLTARFDNDDIRRGMNLGADDFIAKPFKADDLLSSIKIRLAKQRDINSQVATLKENIAHYVPHELRTPLVSILGFSEYLIEDLEQLNAEEIISILKEINGAGEKLKDRIDKFLMIAELNLIKDELYQFRNTKENYFEIEKVCLQNFLTGIFEKRKRRNDLLLNVTNAKVLIPEKYLKYIITELIDNAFKFSQNNSPVEITGSPIGNYYLLSVLNFGIGFSKEELKSINRNTQFEGNKFQNEINGIGLYLIKEVLKIIKGKFTIESVENEYAKIFLSLPLYNNIQL